MPGFDVRALNESTWPDFARLVEANNGVWGGCWCMGFHPEGVGSAQATGRSNREAKERRVREGRAHAALVYDGDDCVGWCQFGSPEELTRIKHQRAYLDGAPTNRRTGVSPASSSARATAARESRRGRWRAHWS